MLAMLFAIKIVNGEKEFKEVPRLLKQKVADELISMGVPELITEEEYKPTT